MKYYKSVRTGKVLDEVELNSIDDVFGKNTVNNALEDGIVIEIAPPSVVDFVLMNREVLAIKRYRDINGCTVAEARNEVDKIKAEMQKIRNMEEWEMF